MTVRKLFAYVGIISCLTYFISTSQYLPNVDCNSYTDYVATDPVYHQYTPYIVKLNRCHGANIGGGNPHNKRCLPLKKGVQNISIIVFDPFNKIHFVTVQNHTSCREECIISKSSCTPYQTFDQAGCSCTCNYVKTPQPDPCVKPFIWDQLSCGCVCPHADMKCEKRKEFTKETCGCACKMKFRIRCTKRSMLIDESSCTCVAPTVVTGASKGTCEGDVKGGILAVVMILEALAFIVAYFFLYSYCYKRRYLPRREEKKNSFYNASQYSNGRVPIENHRRPNEFNTISVDMEEEEVATSQPGDEKTLIEDEQEDKNENYEERRVEKPVYYADEEKSPFAPKRGDDDDEWYTYNDVMEVELPPYSNSSDGRLPPPDYSDYVSELSEDGGHVTQV